MTNFERTLDAAKKYSLEHPEDCHLAIYMVRDYQELRDVGLSDMAWSLHRAGYVSPEDATWFFEEIDKRLITGDPREGER